MAFNFGNPTTTPSTTQSAFSFGSNTTFGAATPSQGGFNLPLGTSTPATSNAATGGFTFGASTTAQPAAPATGGFTFGAQPASSGLTFGATPLSAPSLSLGGLKPTAAATPLKPAAVATTTAQSLNFFSPAPPAAATTAAPTTGLSFGVNSNTAIKFNPLTQPSTSSGPSFIGPATKGFNAAKTTASTGLTFNTPTTGTSGGLFGLGSVTTTTSGASTVTTTAATTFKGLGGVDSATIAGGVSGTTGAGRTENKTVKVNQVPNDIIQSIEGFKSFVKSQKNLSCEVARASAKPLAKVTENTNGLEKLLASLSSDLQKNSILVNKLKDDTSKVFAQCEMAQRTHDTPAGLQNENVAPLEFFLNLVASFEHSAQVLRQQIDNTEKHVNTLNQPAMLTSQELLTALRRLHESFVALAGRLQLVHQMVTAEKQRHLAMRRHFLKDTTDIFLRDSASSDQSAAAKRSVVGVATGPTPFSSLGGSGLMLQQQQPIAVQDTFNSQSNIGWGSSMPTSSSVQGIGSSSSFNFFSSSSTDNFQLSKPPPGNKRGKR
ncbi:nucleoporin p58/p45 [Nilaparvata lugens]|uniref:nucleoporin p58/p45 n=1 Tax=Nilaparvata lugens TaxID=108931 RepID=UPI00193D63B1|nr:nucleoporin p58/p45 [Nilaparvata lugens]